MSEPTTDAVPEPVATRPRWRRLRRLFVAVLVLVPIAIVGLRFYALHAARARASAIIARLDRTDPGWRFAAIEAARAEVPNAENAARTVLDAAQRLPENWLGARILARRQAPGDPRPQGPPTLGERLTGLEPSRLYDAEQARALGDELARLGPALAIARRLKDQPRGRYRVDWRPNYLTTPLPQFQDARSVAFLLQFDALDHAQRGDLSGAFASWRAAVNAGRSIGDEPSSVPQMVRLDADRLDASGLQRLLAQGVTADVDLKAAQSLLDTEARSSPLVIGLRGERAQMADLLDRLARGSVPSLTGEPADAAGPIGRWLYAEAIFRRDQAVVLEEMTRALTIAGRPPSERAVQFQLWGIHLARARAQAWIAGPAQFLLPGMDAFAAAALHSRTYLALARTALAAERFRLANGRWPETLADLAPSWIDVIPPDPFARNQVIRSKRLADGLVIYSVGPDDNDDGAPLDKLPFTPGSDFPFRLWDPNARRQPAEVQELPKDVFAP